MKCEACCYQLQLGPQMSESLHSSDQPVLSVLKVLIPYCVHFPPSRSPQSASLSLWGLVPYFTGAEAGVSWPPHQHTPAFPQTFTLLHPFTVAMS